MEHSFINLNAYLEKHDKFIISTHESPDADGIGAEIAFIELLRHLGKTSVIINSDPIPDNIDFIDIDGDINLFDDYFTKLKNPEEYAHFILDTNNYDNIGHAYLTLKDTVKDVFIIDHHEGGSNIFADNFIRSDVSCCCEIIYDIRKYYGLPLTFKSAQAIYAGMVFDTGSFRYPKTSPHTYRIAAECIENGANPMLVYENLYERNSLSSFALRSKIAASMRIMENGKMVVQKLTPEMLSETGAAFVEGETSINTPLTVQGVIASILVKQDYNGPVKVSMRTKGDYDVARIAIEHNGGGHKNAAGFKSKLSFDDAYDEVVGAVSQLIRKEADRPV